MILDRAPVINSISNKYQTSFLPKNHYHSNFSPVLILLSFLTQ